MLLRARLLSLIVLAVSAAAAWSAQAEDFPSRPIRIVIPYPAGGPTDVLARMLAEALGPRLGQPLIVDDRPGGAGGTVGARLVASADPDGYTLLISQVGALTINPAIYKDAEHAWTKLLAPVALVAQSPQLLAVNPGFPAKSLPELLDYARAHPGKVNFASAGIGSQPHILGELLQIVGHVKLVHVPYRGSAPAITDLLGGQVQMMFDTPVVLLPHVQAGRLRPLAITGATRSPLLPDVPTMAEIGMPQLQASLWSGMMAPANTPAPIVEKLNATLNEAMRTQALKASLAKLGAEPHPLTVAEYTEFMAAETRRWSDVVAQAGIKPE